MISNVRSSRVRKPPLERIDVHVLTPPVPQNTSKHVSFDSVSIEVTKQLRELKQQLNKEFIEDLKAMQADILGKIDDRVRAEVDKQVRIAMAAIGPEIDRRVSKATESVVAANNKQMVVARESTRELVAVASQEIFDDVYDRVITEINEKVVPKVDNMMQWVNYKTRDETETIDSYRRAVEHQITGDRRLLTDGKNDSRIITPHVRTFFGDSD
jgi:hypothetical protein